MKPSQRKCEGKAFFLHLSEEKEEEENSTHLYTGEEISLVFCVCVCTLQMKRDPLYNQ